MYVYMSLFIVGLGFVCCFLSCDCSTFRDTALWIFGFAYDYADFWLNSLCQWNTYFVYTLACWFCILRTRFLFVSGMCWLHVGVCVCLIDHRKSILTNAFSIFRCCLCSCLPYCMSNFMSVHHFCPKCKNYIGTWKGWAKSADTYICMLLCGLLCNRTQCNVMRNKQLPCLSHFALRETAIRRDCHRSYYKTIIYVMLIPCEIRYECNLLRVNSFEHL